MVHIKKKKKKNGPHQKIKKSFYLVEFYTE